MKRTELKRKPMKNTQPRRDWAEARAKVEREETCRAGRHGGCEGRLEAAHIIGRDRDSMPPQVVPPGVDWGYDPSPRIPVAEVRVVPLCTRHHRLYDAHELDLLGHLTPEEEAQAVLDSDGLEAARRRLCPTEYRKAAA